MQTYSVSIKKYFYVESAKHFSMIQWFNVKTFCVDCGFAFCICVDCGFAFRYVPQNDINKAHSFSALKSVDFAVPILSNR